MASVGVAPTSGFREASGNGEIGVDVLPEEMNDMKIRDDRVWCSFCSFFALSFVLCVLL